MYYLLGEHVTCMNINLTHVIAPFYCEVLLFKVFCQVVMAGRTLSMILGYISIDCIKSYVTVLPMMIIIYTLTCNMNNNDIYLILLSVCFI